MAQQNRTVLKTYFETGDTPTQAQFADLIDSAANIAEDGAPLTDASAFATAAQGALAATAVQPAGLTPYLTTATAASTYEPLKGADDNYVTDAEKIVIGNTSGSNTGDQDLSGKQDVLVSGTNIKTINSTSLLGAGNITISAGSVEGTAVLSTGETGGTKFLREDGDGTSSWQAIPGGGDALTSSPLSQFAATTSSQLAGVISDETGTGALVFATSPTLVTPALGEATATTVNGVALMSGGDSANFLNESGSYAAVTKTNVGLGNVDNTSDANKPVSTAQQTALDLKANKSVTINDQTGTTYTLVLADAGKLVRCSNAAAIAVTIPTNASVAYPTGTVITISQVGAGQVTVGGAGVTLNAYQGAKTQGQYAAVQIVKTATDTWTLFGGKA